MELTPAIIIIALVCCVIPVAYVYFVNVFVNHDLEQTDELADTDPGQTHHTGIINTHTPDGHTDHAADDELLPSHRHVIAH